MLRLRSVLVLLGSPKRSPFRGSLATTNVLAVRQTLGLAVITSPGMIPFLTLERETVKLVSHNYSSYVVKERVVQLLQRSRLVADDVRVCTFVMPKGLRTEYATSYTTQQ